MRIELQHPLRDDDSFVLLPTVAIIFRPALKEVSEIIFTWLAWAIVIEVD